MKTRKDILRPIRRLIRAQCTSLHNSNKCHACPGDQSTCSFFREDGRYPEYLREGKVRCKYFETHVLPADKKLEAIYWGRHPEGIEQQIGKCSRCNKQYRKVNNRQQFCTDCKGIVSRQNARERKRRSRQEKTYPAVTL